MNENIKKTILVVDDNESNIDMILAILKEYDVIPSTSGEDALALVKEESIDLMLLDILMPGMDGYAVCQRLKNQAGTQDIPVIFITAKTDEESIEKAYDIGGADFVTKPFKPKELLARVKVQLKLQTVLRELDFLATRDSLTGIYNRRKFFQLAEQMYAKASDDLYAVMIDIDHFKRVNDRYGHHTGDDALKNITRAISQALPKSSLFGRMGGEEFAVLLKTGDHTQAMNVVSLLQQKVSETLINIGDGSTISCTISSGVACNQGEITTLDQLLRQADTALYKAKEGGRNQSIFRNV
ncbi:diguanylate cyclase [Desulfobacter vibrioformis]|uniref:diguanylate cyclase n=1 Tax=Desulfobacter vibrioformis TaxID=34031 RepID=UPI00068B2BA3|nr:diguanylate cyclase [Desulfobacter vibrioformis]